MLVHFIMHSIVFFKSILNEVVIPSFVYFLQEYAQLRKACEQAIEELGTDRMDEGQDITTNVLPSKAQFIYADRYFLPFDLACHSKSPRIIIIALDCLQVTL